jgi:hypothetical protein
MKTFPENLWAFLASEEYQAALERRLMADQDRNIERHLMHYVYGKPVIPKGESPQERAERIQRLLRWMREKNAELMQKMPRDGRENEGRD